eukprot:TRINITY_DN7633_c0_g1_i2.p1 TRINITY_DN7633_c0_g1~~TRINITY_DN7633_c0_g1_i2.p1  ORF type:complete len:194 (+),score=29.73 TRINITY_DN7633_c0_g1_i2:41-583(+)
MSNAKVVAWGEIGLDYHYDLSDRETQKKVFSQQISKAIELKKPLVIHTREAEEDTYTIMKELVPKDWNIHIHCFTSSKPFAEKLLSEWDNLFIGFTGVITFGTAQNVRDVCKIVPLDRFLLETDGPYMAPTPFRGKTCHSGHIPYIAKKIAEVKEIPIEKVFEEALKNTKRMYGITQSST